MFKIQTLLGNILHLKIYKIVIFVTSLVYCRNDHSHFDFRQTGHGFFRPMLLL